MSHEEHCSYSKDSTDEYLIDNDVDVTSSDDVEDDMPPISEIRQRTEDGINILSTILCLSKSEASILLRHYNWDVSYNDIDAWFDDELVRTKVGLLENPAPADDDKVDDQDSITGSCGLCFNGFPGDALSSASCGHLYCKTCWSSCLRTSMDDEGFGCFDLRCPEKSCGVVVDQYMLDSLLSEEDRKKYFKYLVGSVERSKIRKWCPGADCEDAIEICGGVRDVDFEFDVTCRCFTTFCWSCNREGHRPVDCVTARKWIVESDSDAKKVKTVIVTCKPCPECKRPNQKKRLTIQMKCCQCGHEFCWLYVQSSCPISCARYYEDPNMEDQESKKHKKKYTLYAERWDSNRRGKVGSLEEWRRMKESGYFECLSQELGLRLLQILSS
ncbi:hypothetical protein Tsubulata_048887 [Turnera subulata]|uniref:RBR-type E3 ubiquitin transferase n=1 Tax=Turnera subulata TaxID=218843 RepID=A0A9Q0FVE7_9ROSI|nr:hypothetical protein Tsubulata_048887 [Turnera subulata]